MKTRLPMDVAAEVLPPGRSPANRPVHGRPAGSLSARAVVRGRCGGTEIVRSARSAFPQPGDFDRRPRVRSRLRPLMEAWYAEGPVVKARIEEERMRRRTTPGASES